MRRPDTVHSSKKEIVPEIKGKAKNGHEKAERIY